MVCEGNKGHLPTDLHLSVLTQLRDILQTEREVILLGDGEFDSSQVQEFIRASGWFYVLRTAKDTWVETSQGDTFAIREAYPEEDTRHLWIEDVWVFKHKYGKVNALVWHETSFEQPLYLLSNLETGLEVMQAYPKRFSIETLFGDLKSRGFHIDRVRIKKPEMLSNLLIIVALAFLLIFALGLCKQQYKDIWGKIIRKDRVKSYSTFQMGQKIAQWLKVNNLTVNQLFCFDFLTAFSVRF